MQHGVVFLPGIIAPAAVRYRALIEALRGVQASMHDLAVYDGETPPSGYSISTEIDALDRFADAAQLDQFHVFGHSGGGAVALAYAMQHGERVVSLAVDEPASDFTAEGDAEYGWPEFDAALALPPGEAMAEFMRLQVASDVTLPAPPDGPPPPWMVNRPRGDRGVRDRAPESPHRRARIPQLRRAGVFQRGARTHPRWTLMQMRLARLFPDFSADVFEGLHHLDPAHQAAPDRVAAILSAFWERAERPRAN